MKALTTTALIVLIAVLAFGVYQFLGDSLGYKTLIGAKELSAFGTFLAGAVTPITIIIAIMALQHRQKTHYEELSSLKKQSLKRDVLLFIEKIEDDLAKRLDSVNINIKLDDSEIHATGHNVLFDLTFLEWERVIPNENDIMSHLEENKGRLERNDSKVFAFEAFSAVASYLNAIQQHCDAYQNLTDSNITTLYFYRKYREGLRRLKAKGYAIEEWPLPAQQKAQADAE